MGTFSMSDVNNLFNAIVSVGCNVVSDKDLYGLRVYAQKSVVECPHS